VFTPDRDVPEVGGRVPVARHGRDRQPGEDSPERLRQEPRPETLAGAFRLLGGGRGDDAVDEPPPAVDGRGDGVGRHRHSFVDGLSECDPEPDGQLVTSRHRQVVSPAGSSRDRRRVAPVRSRSGSGAESTAGVRRRDDLPSVRPRDIETTPQEAPNFAFDSGDTRCDRASEPSAVRHERRSVGVCRERGGCQCAVGRR
jgi:hypothetical protein